MIQTIYNTKLYHNKNNLQVLSRLEKATLWACIPCIFPTNTEKKQEVVGSQWVK